MKDNIKTAKISLIITVFSVILSIVGIIFAVLNLRYSIASGKPTGYAITSFWSALALFFATITQFILTRNRYKNHSK
jgi:uncharacterized membrane protein